MTKLFYPYVHTTFRLTNITTELAQKFYKWILKYIHISKASQAAGKQSKRG